MKLTDFLISQTVEAQAPVTSSARVLDRLVKLVEAPGEFMDPKILLSEIRQREKLGSTGIGEGVAIPHIRVKGLPRMHVAMLTTKSGVDFGAVDDVPCRIFIIVAAPDENRDAYLNLLSAVSGLLRREDVRKAVTQATSPGDLLYTLRAAEGA